MIKLTTYKTLNETVASLEKSILANHFGIMQVHNLKTTMKKKGIEFARECLIFDVCQPEQAKKILDKNMSTTVCLAE